MKTRTILFLIAVLACGSLQAVHLEIPEGTTSIGANAYYGRTDITSVTIPDSVTRIELSAFDGCSGLTSVTIPDSVTSIQPWAFYGCSGLTSVTIGNSVTSIGWGVFQHCSGLTSVVIPDSVTSIESNTFADCSGLRSVTIGKSVASIGYSAFLACTGLTTMIFEGDAPRVFDSAFLYTASGCKAVVQPGALGWEIGSVWCGLKVVPAVEFTIVNGVLTKAICNADGVIAVIPDSVTSIGNNAFEGCNGPKSVTIPDSVTSIGNSAFYGCSRLTSVTIPDSVTSIGEGAFEGTPYVESLPDGLVILGRVAYKMKGTCPSSVVIKDGVVSIFPEAFSGCSGLKSVAIPDSVTTIGANAFSDCSGLKSVTIPDSVTSIGKGAFSGCSGLTSVTIPDSVTSIGNYAFEGCSGLTGVTIPDSVTSIGNYAFNGCSGLTGVTIPDSVTSIGNYAFNGCSGLTSVTIGKSVTSIGDSAFSGCSGLTSVTIGNGVTSIGSGAFYGCSGLTSVTIPDSVKSIGVEAFEGCSGLMSVTIGKSVTSIGNYAFYGCGGLTSVTIGKSVTSIGDSAFSGCSGLTSVTIGNGVTSIGSGAFYGCSGLTSVTIPDSVKSIGVEAFEGCSGLMSVTIGKSVTSIGNYAFYGCGGLTSVTIPDSVTSIGRRAFEGCYGLTSVAIQGSVTSIGDRAFYGCDNVCEATVPGWQCGISFGNVTNLVISAGATSIGDRAFRSCSSLTSVTIGNGVTSIGNGAFYGCSGLTSVTIPDSVTSIGGDAFSGCRGLTGVTIGDCVTSIGDGAFYGCSGLMSVTIPDSVTSIGNSAFCWCSGLRSVTIGKSVTSIGKSAFAKCSGLTSVTIPDSVTSIGEYAFGYCYSLQRIVLPIWLRNRVDEEWVFFGCSSDLEIVYDDGIGRLVNDAKLDIYEAAECDRSIDVEVAHDGIASVRLNGRGINSDSAIEMKVAGAGRLSFWWKASSEYDSEGDDVYDYGFLSVDGEELGYLRDYRLYGHAIGGVTDWANVVLDIVGDGEHTISWIYRKDDYDTQINGLKDCIWLDEIVWTPLVSASFALGGGNGTAPDTIAELAGSVVVLPTEDGFWRDGYVFAGWSDGINTYAGGAEYAMQDDDTVLSAQWTRKSVLVFWLGGGTGSLPNIVKALPGAIVILPAEDGFWRDGYVFVGWRSEDGVLYRAGDEYALPDHDVEFTAEWIRKSILTFDLDGGTGPELAAITDIPGVVVTLPGSNGLAKAKHNFAGWSDGNTIYSAGADYVLTTSDVGFVAQWTPKTISIPAIASAQAENGGEVTDAESVTLTLTTDGGATIHYTLDGTVPTAGSPVYTEPLVLTDYEVEVTVKAIAIRDDYFDSEIAEFSFKRYPYTLVECLGLDGIDGVTVSVGGDGEAWHQALKSESHDGWAGVRSGIISNSQTNWIEVAVDGPGTISFWWKASSEEFRGKPRDGAMLFVDGVQDGAMIGGTKGDWEQRTVAIEGESVHRIRWVYGKSSTDSSDIGEDCAWLDEVVWTKTPTEWIIHDGVLIGVNPGEQTEVEIPAGVTSIGDRAFAGCSGLTSVTIPDSVDSIGDWAFEDCDGLTSVSIPDSVTSIGDGAFYGCSGLTSVTIGNGVESIGYRAFRSCSSLTSVSIGNGVTSIGDEAFYGCSGLVGVTIPDSVTSIGDGAFYGCSGLTSVTIPDSVTSIGNRAFYVCGGLTSVTIPDGVTSIGDRAFCWCSGLTSVTIPDSVTSMGEYAFSGCIGLKSVTIGNGVTRIVDNAFEWCYDLTSVTIPDGVTSIGNYAFNDCSGLTSVTIGNSVTSIGNSAFAGCSGLKSVTIPDSVTSIGSWAFEDCDALYDTVTIPGVKLVDGWAIGYTSSLTADLDLSNARGIGDSAFYYCRLLTSVMIPGTVTSISDYAFCECSGLTSVMIGNGVTNIGHYAFAWCYDLTSVTIPDSVTSIGDDSRSSMGEAAFVGTPFIMNLPNGLVILGKVAYQMKGNCPADMVIPDGVVSISAEAFQGCSGLASITIPDSMTSIRGYAFQFCSGLTSVTFKGNAPQVGPSVFNGVADGCVARVLRTATGFEVDAEGKWNGLKVEYYGEEPQLQPSIEGDDGAEVLGDEDAGYTVRPSAETARVEVTIPEGVSADKVTVQVTANVEKVKANGATIQVMSGEHDVSEYVKLPEADLDGFVDLTEAVVKPEIVEALLVEDEAEVSIGGEEPLIRTAETKPGLTYHFREGTSLEAMRADTPLSKAGDGQAWEPTITVKDPDSSFYELKVTW